MRRATLYLLTALAMPFLSVAAPAVPQSCAVGHAVRQAALKLSWDEFDQKDVSPASFRHYAKRECYREAGELIEYYLANKPELDISQQRLSRFHAGQMYASAGNELRALPLIRSAHNPDQTADEPLDWNSYVAGVVAFLEKERTALASARTRLQGMGGNNPVNARVLLRMETCFDKTYMDIWGSDCAPEGSN